MSEKQNLIEIGVPGVLIKVGLPKEIVDAWDGEHLELYEHNGAWVLELGHYQTGLKPTPAIELHSFLSKHGIQFERQSLRRKINYRQT